MGMRIRRAWTATAVGLVVAAAATGCITPTPGGGGGGVVPPCPARQKLVVEQTDQTDYSLVRGVSANGKWVVTSRTVAGMLQLTLRELGSSAPGVSVGSIPADPIYDPHAVAVADDGSRVAYFAYEAIGPRTVVRWARATGDVTTIQPPSPGLAWPEVGPDATLIGWRTSLSAEAVVVTNSLTDELVGSAWGRLAPYDDSAASRSGRFRGVTDASDGSTIDLGPAYDEIGSDDVGALSISPDGSQYLLRGTFDWGGAAPTIWHYDATTQDLVELDSGWFLGGQIADDGRAVVVRVESSLLQPAAIQEFAADGTMSTLQASGRVELLAHFDSNPYSHHEYFVATPDLRTVVFTAFTTPLPPTAVVYASRCQ